MPRRKWTFAVIGLVAAVGVAAAGVWLAARHEPEFYRKALEVDSQTQVRGSDDLLAQTAAVVSQARKPGAWSALFTVNDLNGWLAVDLPKNFAELLPAEVAEPRVRLTAGRLRLACRYDEGPLGPAVISIDLEAHVTEPNVVAVRLHSMKAGALPLPLADVVNVTTQLAARWQVPIRWGQKSGDPVALVDLTPISTFEGKRYQIETVELREGGIRLAGQTLPVAAAGPK